jgi:lipoyl(octanoyl) transferase
MIIFKDLQIIDYQESFALMQSFTASRTENTTDEIWFLEHPPVFTQGIAGKSEHILKAGDIPVIQSNRGGQVTFHTYGQLVTYLLIDLKRRKLQVRQLVKTIEDSIIELLSHYQIQACNKDDAPGVYVDGKKIASLGLKISKGCSMHGFALNINADLKPFQMINPCGYKGLQMVNLQDLTSPLIKQKLDMNDIKNQMQKILILTLE